MLRNAIGLTLIAVLGACSTNSSYRVPDQPPPPTWDGQAGIAPVIDTTISHSGEMQEGDELMSFAVERVRTGVLTSDLTYEIAPDKFETIPAGTKLYGAQYTLSMQTTYNGARIGSATNLNARNNPIEWCTAPDEGAGQCIFWQGDDVVIITASGQPLIERLIRTSGPTGPVPEIDETDVDFGVTVRTEVIVQNLNKRRVTIATRMKRSDGPSQQVTAINRVWDEERSATVPLYGGQFKLTALGDPEETPTTVNVEIIKEPANMGGPDTPPSPEEALMLLLMQARAEQEAAAAAAEGEAEAETDE